MHSNYFCETICEVIVIQQAKSSSSNAAANSFCKRCVPFFISLLFFFCLSLLNTSFISKCANRWNQKMHTLLEHVQTESGLQIRFWPCDHFQLIPIWFRKVVSRWIRIHSKEAREKTQQQQQNHTIKWKIEFKGEKEIRFVCRQVQAINKSVYNANDSSGWNKQKKE